MKIEAIFQTDMRYMKHMDSPAIKSGDLFVSGQVGSLNNGSAEPDFF
jgi:hypothetical protein